MGITMTIPSWVKELRGVRLFGLSADGLTAKEIAVTNKKGDPAFNVITEGGSSNGTLADTNIDAVLIDIDSAIDVSSANEILVSFTNGANNLLEFGLFISPDGTNFHLLHSTPEEYDNITETLITAMSENFARLPSNTTAWFKLNVKGVDSLLLKARSNGSSSITNISWSAN